MPNILTCGRIVKGPSLTCPRCAGRLYEDADYAGRFRSCINCGEMIPLDGYDPEGKPPGRSSKGRPRLSRLRGTTTAQRSGRGVQF